MNACVRRYYEVLDSEILEKQRPTFVRDTSCHDVFVYIRSGMALSVYYRYYGRFNRRPSVRYLRDHGIKLKLIKELPF